MQDLGRITNHHVALSPAEIDMVINALDFFYEKFSPQPLTRNWQDVANDTYLPGVRTLSENIARAAKL